MTAAEILTVLLGTALPDNLTPVSNKLIMTVFTSKVKHFVTISSNHFIKKMLGI
jgi:hypothetical protein